MRAWTVRKAMPGDEKRISPDMALDTSRKYPMPALVTYGLRCQKKTGGKYGAFVVEGDDGTVIGTGSVRVAGKKALLHNLLVSPDYRRMGIGRELTRRRVEHAFANGATRVVVELEKPAKGIPAYKKLGFRVSGFPSPTGRKVMVLHAQSWKR